MGLTGGFADVGGLFDCFYGIYSGQADESILDKYDEIRREKYWKVIDPVSSGNLQRLWHPERESIEKDEFFQAIKKAETDRGFAKEMAEVSVGVVADVAVYCGADLYVRSKMRSCMTLHSTIRMPRARFVVMTGGSAVVESKLDCLEQHSKVEQAKVMVTVIIQLKRFNLGILKQTIIQPRAQL